MNWNSLASFIAVFLGIQAFGAAPLLAQEFPSRPIRMIVPYPPGGSTTILARLFATKMGEKLGQPIVTDNRGGAGTIIGTRAVAESAPDGYTMLFTTSALLAAPYAYKDAGFKVEDFRLVDGIGITSMAIRVHTSVPAKTLPEFIAYTRNHDLSYSTNGSASPGRLLISRFMAIANIKMVEIMYSGTGQSQTDLLAGVVQVNLTTAALSLADLSRVRPLAVTSTRRLPFLPDVPTFTELGYPDMIGGTWFALFVPVRTPEPIVQRLADTVARTNAEKDVQEKRTAIGISPFEGNRDAVQSFIRKDFELTLKDIKRVNLQPE